MRVGKIKEKGEKIIEERDGSNTKIAIVSEWAGRGNADMVPRGRALGDKKKFKNYIEKCETKHANHTSHAI